ncbi:tyrosine-type recombinase/integrase [Halocynthiibacter sp. C4]|uniref:tyrosine-type recombinase/integrase n=1 Tax=Halocynthiibacter sp. C4 TaxID=2992758 RepID=UPI00237BC3E0|nr:tyrosine-type recombinase/integrase [Halocynthiibacter sp. C4]MDE0590456.1 tyrosine-type recombinase/integrase [Halocynthiibacter sp. C4]
MGRGNRKGVKLKHLNRSGEWPSGNPRYYFRPKGEKGKPLPDLPMEHPDFLKAYALLAKLPASPTLMGIEGTTADAIDRYLRSDNFNALAPSSQQLWRRISLKLREAYGHAPLTGLQSQHIRADISKFTPHPANSRLKVWRSLCAYWHEFGLIPTNPAIEVRKRKAAKSTGFKAWTHDDVRTFRAYWPIDSQERVAFEVLYRSCAAISDAVALGPNMVEDGWLTYTRKKSHSMATAPFSGLVAPEWFDWTDDLERALAAQTKRHFSLFICTTHGKPRSHKAAASWFSRACTAAGLPDLSAHGVRKYRASMFKENGATPEQRMAILGHETKTEADRYSKSADLRKVITNG